MRAGRLRHRVAVESPVASRNSLGEETVTWRREASAVPASVEPLAAREYFASQQLAMEVTHLVTLRYRPGIRPTWRVVHDGRAFDITAVRDLDERHRTLELLCREIV